MGYKNAELRLGKNDTPLDDPRAGEVAMRIDSAGSIFTKPEGAGEVAITGAAVIHDTVEFNESYTETGLEEVATVFWDSTAGEMKFVADADGTISIGKETYDNMVNLSGGAVVDGDVVSITGASGNRQAFDLTDATDKAKSLACVGMVTVTSIGDNQRGRITKSGVVRNLDTSAFAEGSLLYVDPLNPGKLTDVEPPAGDYIIAVGTVTISHATEGRVDIKIHVTHKLSELSDVNGTPLTEDGQILVWDNTAGYFDATANINDHAPAFASIHNHGTLTSQAVLTGATYTKLTNFTDNGQSLNCTPDAANDKITITTPGYYKILGTFNFECDINNIVWYIALFEGGVEIQEIHIKRKTGVADDVGSASFVGVISAPTAPIDLDVRARHDNVGTVNITVEFANLTVNKIASI